MAESPSVNSPEASVEESLADLSSLLGEKRDAAAREGQQLDEREAFGKAFQERYGEALTLPSVTPASPRPSAPLVADEVAKHAEAVTAIEGDDAKLNALVGIAFSRGIYVAAWVSRQATPWLMDALHDALRDQYYDRLIREKKLRAP